MTTVYVVTHGDYSDYSIKAVCSTRAIAEEFISHMDASWGTPRIEEWPLDGAIEKKRQGLTFYFGRISRDGEVTNLRVDDWDYVEQGGLSNGFDMSGNLMWHTWAKDESHAAKILNEKRSALIAAGVWTANTETPKLNRALNQYRRPA